MNGSHRENPAVQLLAALSYCRSHNRHLSFEEAWVASWSAIDWPNYPGRHDWQEALRETKADWERAFRQEPCERLDRMRHLILPTDTESPEEVDPARIPRDAFKGGRYATAA